PNSVSGNPSYAGVAITATDCNITKAGKCTITTSSAHGFRPGDMVTVLFTDNAAYWGDALVATVPTATTFTYTNSRTIASQSTPGVVALAYDAILDNAGKTHFIAVQCYIGGNSGRLNN